MTSQHGETVFVSGTLGLLMAMRIIRLGKSTAFKVGWTCR